MNPTKLANVAWSFAKRYRTTLLAWLVVLTFGLLSYNVYLDRRGFPSIQLPIAFVQGEYAVGDATKVDEEVVQPLVAELSEIESIDSFSATSRNDQYLIIINFTEDTDINDGVEDVEAAIADNLTLSDDVNPIVQSVDPGKFNASYDLIFSVYGNADSTYQQLQSAAEQAKTDVVMATEVKSAETQPIIQQVAIPNTNQTTTLQNGINYIGVRDNNNNLNFFPAVNVGVVATDDTDALQLSSAVQDILDESYETNNQVSATITADFADSINQQINSLESNLLSGLIAVVAVSWLLISWRAATVIALFIPTVLAATFLGLNLGGQTLNTITLFSTILTLGLFVDDATIVAEAIEAKRRNANAKQAIKSAISRIGTASLAGTLTTVLVFTPMLAVSGILGEFISLLPITVIMALAVSFVISMTLAPFLARLFVLPQSQNRGLKLLDRLSISPLITKFGSALSKLPQLNKTSVSTGRIVSTAAVSVSVGFIIAGGYLATQLPLAIFPETKDANQLQATVDFSRSEISQNPAQLKSFAESLNQQLSEVIGSELEQVSYLDVSAQGAIIQIELSDFKSRDTTSQEFLTQLNNRAVDVNGVEVSYNQLDAGPPTEEFPFQVRISGQQPALDNTVNEVASFISDNSVDVNGETVTITSVETNQDGAVRRSDDGLYRTVSAGFSNSELISGSVAALEDKLTKEFDEQRLEELGLSTDALNFDVSLESQNAESFESIQFGLIAAVAGMYLLLVLLFNSLSQPLLILTAVPFSIFGVFGGLEITNNPLSFFVMVGFLGLIGIVVNNSILLVEYANQERAAGKDRWDAIAAAIKERFRPLVTTTTTTVVALLPLAWSDPFWQPLAYTLIFGLISSTTLIIISFPYYYLALERMRDWKNRRFPFLA